MTPIEYATNYLALDMGSFWEVISYTDFPFYARGELDIPDNWWDYDGYYNVPLDAWIRTINRALDGGYPVVIDTDWGDMGASWNGAGLAVMHPVMMPGYLIKNSHGTSSGRRGYVWIRGDWMAMRVLAYMVHVDAVDSSITGRFAADH